MTSSVIGGLVEALRRDISLGELVPGQKLQIANIGSLYGASGPSVREALSILSGEKFVEAIDQRGFFVSDISVDELKDLAKVRAELECVAVRWSLANSNRQWRSQVVAAHHMLKETEEELHQSMKATLLEWDENNRSFHLTIAGNCGSASLIELIRNQYDVSRRFRLRAYAEILTLEDRQEWLSKSSKEHDSLRDMVLAGDSIGAENLLRQHIIKAP